MLHAAEVVAVHAQSEVGRGLTRVGRLHNTADEPILLKPVPDQVRDRDDRDVVRRREALEVRHPRHGAVVVEDLADDGRRIATGQAAQVDRPFGLPGTHEDASTARAQREDVPGADEVLRSRAGRDGGLHRPRAVRCRDARRDAFTRLDRHREGRAELRRVLLNHHGKLQLIQPLLCEREADESAAVHGHEVDRFGRDLVRGEDEVALVLAVFVIDEDDHPASADGIDGGLDGGEGHA